MKNLFACFCGIALIGQAACANPSSEKEIKGYPVYKFLQLGEINEKALKVNETATRELLGKGYDDYVRVHELFVSRGFDLHTPLMVRVESGEEIEVYVRNEDNALLWKTSPHDLAKQKKSHLVTIKYVQIRVGGESVNRAVSFQAQLVDREPIIRK